MLLTAARAVSRWLASPARLLERMFNGIDKTPFVIARWIGSRPAAIRYAWQRRCCWHCAPRPDDEAVHLFFELSYSNYQVVHRTLAQSMPGDWQSRWVQCMEELRDAYSHIEHPDGYNVQAVRYREVSQCTQSELEAAGYGHSYDEQDDDGGRPDVWYKVNDPGGLEYDIEPWREVGIPVDDTIPHYNRGRTRVPPRLVVPRRLLARIARHPARIG